MIVKSEIPLRPEMSDVILKDSICKEIYDQWRSEAKTVSEHEADLMLNSQWTLMVHPARRMMLMPICRYNSARDMPEIEGIGVLVKGDMKYAEDEFEIRYY